MVLNNKIGQKSLRSSSSQPLIRPFSINIFVIHCQFGGWRGKGICGRWGIDGIWNEMSQINTPRKQNPPSCTRSIHKTRPNLSIPAHPLPPSLPHTVLCTYSDSCVKSSHGVRLKTFPAVYFSIQSNFTLFTREFSLFLYIYMKMRPSLKGGGGVEAQSRAMEKCLVYKRMFTTKTEHCSRNGIKICTQADSDCTARRTWTTRRRAAQAIGEMRTLKTLLNK